MLVDVWWCRKTFVKRNFFILPKNKPIFIWATVLRHVQCSDKLMTKVVFWPFITFSPILIHLKHACWILGVPLYVFLPYNRRLMWLFLRYFSWWCNKRALRYCPIGTVCPSLPTQLPLINMQPCPMVTIISPFHYRAGFARKKGGLMFYAFACALFGQIGIHLSAARLKTDQAVDTR